MKRKFGANQTRFPCAGSPADEERRPSPFLQDEFRLFHETAPIGYFILKPDTTILNMNLSGARIFGRPPGELKGRRLVDLIAPSDLECVRSFVKNVLAGESWCECEASALRPDGPQLFVLLQGRQSVQVGEVVVFLTDITKRKAAEAALRESEQKYKDVADSLAEGVFEADAAGNVTYANLKVMASLGLGEDDLKNGLKVFDVIAPSNLALAGERFGKVLKQEDVGAGEYTLLRKDGSTFPALVHSLAIVRDGQVVGVRGILIDISERKRAEAALKESERRFRTLLESLHEGIWALDKDDRTTFVNPRMAEMLGYTEQEMLGKPVYAFNDEEWKKFTVAQMERRKRGVKEQLEGELVRKDGGRVYALFETSPILDDDGNYIGSIAGVQDITERRLGEERMKQALAELDRSNKELEHFAYVTSHDLREPLRMMTSFAQSLEKRYKGKIDGTADEYIHFIIDGASRMQRLIDDILVYSRVGTRGQPFEPVDMRKTLEAILLNLRAAIDETQARISSEPLPTIQADPTQMQQVLQNLVGNALKFHRDGDPPVVHISASRKGKDWLFSVKDNGIGMEPELFGRLFVLFQRLHPPDKYPGTGVGLAVTKKIVERHGGRIWVESQPGQGSTFYFSIPVAPKADKNGRA